MQYSLRQQLSMAYRNKRRNSTPIPKSSRSTLVVLSAAKPAAKVVNGDPPVVRDEAAYARFSIQS